MFGLFWRKKPFVDPTEQQRKYAARLGITVSRSMSKADVSAAIAEAECRSPALAEQREKIKRRVIERKSGKHGKR